MRHAPSKNARPAGRLAERPAVLEPLRWLERAARLRTAPAPGGRYVLVDDGLANWTAEWRPVDGRVTFLLVRTTAQLACEACDRHHIGRHTDALLVAEGDDELTQADLQGPALAWKRGR